MKLYNFRRLIDKYSVTFVLRRTGGAYVYGKWEDSIEADEERRGAIVPMPHKKIYSSGGAYTEQDRELYTHTPLGEPLTGLQVIYKGNTYAVESVRNYEDYADAAVYNLKWVSAS